MINENQVDEVPLILVVDDNDQNIGLIGQLLSQEITCDIAIASNGKSAIHTALKKPPDLILLDVMMPDITGYEVCEELKRNPDFNRIPIIFLTAKVEEEDIAEGFRCGAVDYITKPVKHAELLARVKTHLSLRKDEKIISEQLTELRQLNRVVSHDLLNSVNSIIGAFELIKTGLSSEDEDMVMMGGIVDRSLDNIINIIHSVKKAYSLGDSRSVLEIGSYALAPLIDESLLLLSDRINKKEIRIERKVPNGLKVRVDRLSFLNSVINNLLTNAIKFSHRGSTVWVEAGESGDKTVIRVRDNGIGIPPVILAKLFEMTAQTNRAGTEREPGAGYGMPLVKKYVEACGGRVEITSKEKTDMDTDSGTEVVVTLLGT